MTTFTDRYVAAVLQWVPDRNRTDIERELRTSIADALDARVENGEAATTAERAVLTELGDPFKLALGYSGAPRYLIGPNVFYWYVKTLGFALAFSVPTSWFLLAALWLVAGNSLVTAFVTATLGAVFMGLLVAVVTTAGYAAFEWSDEVRKEMREAFRDDMKPWTPDQLPAVKKQPSTRTSEAVEGIIGGVVGIVFILGQRTISPFSDASGQPIPVLNPDLWSFWLPVILVITAGLILAHFAMLARGAWSPGVAAVLTTFIGLSAMAYIYLLATAQLFNVPFFEKLGAAPWIAAGSIPVILAILLTALDSGFRIAKLWGAPIGNGRGNGEQR